MLHSVVLTVVHVMMVFLHSLVIFPSLLFAEKQDFLKNTVFGSLTVPVLIEIIAEYSSNAIRNEHVVL